MDDDVLACLRQALERIAQLEAKISLLHERQAHGVDAVMRMAEQVESMDKAAVILAASQVPAALPRPRRPAAHRGPPRDRHGLHIVPGAAAAALAWTLRSRAHKVAASAATLALAAGTAVAPAVITAPPASGAPTPPAVSRHGPWNETVAVPLMVPTPRARKRRRQRKASPDTVADTPAPSPTPSPTDLLPSPLPTPTLPLPVPTPTLPLPTPSLLG